MSGTLVNSIGFEWMLFGIAMLNFIYAPLMYFLRAPPTKEEKKVSVCPHTIPKVSRNSSRERCAVNSALRPIAVVDNRRKIVGTLRDLPERGRGTMNEERVLSVLDTIGYFVHLEANFCSFFTTPLLNRIVRKKKLSIRVLIIFNNFRDSYLS